MPTNQRLIKQGDYDLMQNIKIRNKKRRYLNRFFIWNNLQSDILCSKYG